MLLMMMNYYFLLFSEILEHEVLPTQSTRMALTMWASGSGNFGKYSQGNCDPSHCYYYSKL